MIDFNIDLERDYDEDAKSLDDAFTNNFVEEVYG